MSDQKSKPSEKDKIRDHYRPESEVERAVDNLYTCSKKDQWFYEHMLEEAVKKDLKR